MPTPLHRLSLTAAVLALAGAGAHAASLLEDFSGDPHPSLWTLDDGGNAWGVDAGQLVFVRGNAGNALLTFTPLLQGDFDVRMDYDVSGWSTTYGGGDRFGLAVTPVGGEGQVFGSAIGYAQEQYLYAAGAGACCNFGPYNPLDDYGTVRLWRHGELLRLQYRADGDWVTLASTTEARDMRLTLSSYIHNGFEPGARYAVDNLSISADAFSAPIPEPTTGALLAAGLATLGWMARRRRA